MKVITKHTSNAAGSGQVIAKGGGKQRTISWDHSVSAERNHGNAAAALALVLFEGETARRVAANTAKHWTQADQSHVFTFGV